MVSKGASDLHLVSGSCPRFRVDGALMPDLDLPALAAPDIHRLVYALLDDQQRRRLEETLEFDFAFSIDALARFRCNVYFERGAPAVAIRILPHQVRTLSQLGLPPVVQQLAQRPQGLVLVTGPTGSGKSTTLSAMLDFVNRARDGHIVTIEDPVEFVHAHRRSLVTQREIGSDARSFASALRTILRQDPDVVLIG